MKSVIRLRFFILIIGSVLAQSNSIAQQHLILNDSVISKVLNEQRDLKIYLPGEIRTGSVAKYDVVYILDCETHFDDFLFISNFAEVLM